MLWFILFVVFILIPVIEITLFLVAGANYGFLPIILMIVFTGLIGMILVRLQGLNVWERMQKNIQNNIPPNEEILDGFCLVLSGVCLITPGFFTDFIGFLLVIPFTRVPFKYLLKCLLKKMTKKGNIYFKKW